MSLSWHSNTEEQYHIHIECSNNVLKKETVESLLESDKKRNSMPHEGSGKRVRFSLSTDVRLIPGLRHDDNTSGSTTPKKSKMKKNNAQYDVELQLAIQLSLGTSSLENAGNSGFPNTPGYLGAYGYQGSSGAFSSGAPGTTIYQGGSGILGTLGLPGTSMYQGPSGYPGIVETGIVETVDIDESWKHTLKALSEDEKREESRGQVLVECPVCSIKKKSKRINQHLEDYHGFN